MVLMGKCDYCGRRASAEVNDTALCQEHHDLLGFMQFARTRGLLVSKLGFDEIPPFYGEPIKMP
jgi:hypothetical protein